MFKVGRSIQIVKRSDTADGFEVLPRRWVVERTFARASVTGQGLGKNNRKRRGMDPLRTHQMCRPETCKALITNEIISDQALRHLRTVLHRLIRLICMIIHAEMALCQRDQVDKMAA